MPEKSVPVTCCSLGSHGHRRGIFSSPVKGCWLIRKGRLRHRSYQVAKTRIASCDPSTKSRSAISTHPRPKVRSCRATLKQCQEPNSGLQLNASDWVDEPIVIVKGQIE